MNKKLKSIVYINFRPYENAGKILDYLLENFENVFLFSFNFHKLGKNQEPSKLKIFKKGHFIKEKELYQINLPSPLTLTFLLLPVRSLMIMIQIIWYSIILKKKYKKLDIYFTVNAFTAWIGNILRSLKIVKKTIFWVWDYYPPINTNKIVTLFRWIYWQFDKIGATSNSLIFLNRRLENLRKDIGILSKRAKYPIVEIGTNPISKVESKENLNRPILFGFIGVVKKSQGLDIFFDTARELKSLLPNSMLEIIGSGPDELYFKRRAKKCPIKTKFYGFLPSENEISRIVSKWDIGIATYIPEESNVSYYGDPSKIKVYLSFGIPVVTTDVYVFSKEVAKSKAGVIIDYCKKSEFISAISIILSAHKQFRERALLLAQKYHYKKIYPKIFNI